MAQLLLGKNVADAINTDLRRRTAALREKGTVPTLAIVRLGDDPADESYLRGARKRGQEVGVEVRLLQLPEGTQLSQLLRSLDDLNADDAIHGVLLLRPLPAALREHTNTICDRLSPRKDVDGMTAASAAGVFTGSAEVGFPPCTAAACMEILDYYGIDCRGKSAVVIGRSQVVGKPAAMLLLGRDATVTLCHTKTPNTAALCRQADIILTAAGMLNSLTGDFVRPGQVVIDVAINYDAGKVTARGVGGIAGDACFQEVEPIVAAITPVPGGVGSVTTSVLMKHVVEAAEK